MNKSTLYTNAVIHTGRSEQDTCSAMLVTDGRISRLIPESREIPSILASSGLRGSIREVDLGGRHVYPCLLDPHIHMLMTIGVMAMGFPLCRFTAHGVEPHTLPDAGEMIRQYADSLPKGTVIAISNFIPSVMDEKRMPTRFELDAWCGDRPAVIYNIDGHSSTLSTAMLKALSADIDFETFDGILTGPAHERNQGRILSFCTRSLTLPRIAKGIGRFQNHCASMGISMVGALEGNGDSPKDPATALIVRLARHFDIGVRLYPQLRDTKAAKPFRKFMSRPRIGGCGDWEMDGSVGSHSAAFSHPFLDTGTMAPCYMTQEEVDTLVAECAQEGYQIASHAIGELAIERILTALEKVVPEDAREAASESLCDTSLHPRLHRIEHCEFPSDETVERLKSRRFAITMQPGYARIDRDYLHTYEQHLPEESIRLLRLKTLYDAGVVIAGSSDSPVQDMDPFLQMAGMTDFYRPEESITPFEAFRCCTLYAAQALEEEKDRGTLEEGKIADFFTADADLFSLTPAEIQEFRPVGTWYAGEPYKQKKGTVGELARMMLSKPKMI